MLSVSRVFNIGNHSDEHEFFTFTISDLKLLQELDSYLKTRAPVTFLTELRSHLQVNMRLAKFIH